VSHDEAPGDRASDADGIGWRVLPAGPGAAALLADAEPSPGLARRLAARRAALLATRPRSVHDLIPSYAGLLAEYRPGANAVEVRRWLGGAVDEAEVPAPRRHDLRVRYGEGADADELEARLGLTWEEVVRLHAGAAYTVAFVGFMPGFPYLLGLPNALRLPRRSTPRDAVPAGAVAIADGQAGVYPRTSPGGWWVVGRCDAPLFDPHSSTPSLLAAGDEVRFVAEPAPAVGEHAFDAPAVGAPASGARASGARAPSAVRLEAPVPGGEPVLEVVDAWRGAVTLQARPRWGVGHHGMAQAGPLDGNAHAAAQDILGDSRATAVLELTVPSLTLRALADVTAVATGGGVAVHADGRPVPTWRPFSLRAGATLELAPDAAASGATAYLAFAGGVEAVAPPTAHPDLLASRSTDVRGGVGGFGRALRAGDALALSGPPGPLRAWPGRPRYGERALLRLHPGLQHDAKALEALHAARFVVASRDRTGARLEGPQIHLGRHDVVSQGVPWGAVQLPADGKPIVLLADRGRTGGYAVPAIVDPRDLWQLAQARPGSEVWFVPPDAFR
jgi:KipI family sensor histidine kinase inhibitor